MKILGIETSSRSGNVCLAEKETIILEKDLGDGMIHGKELIPAIDHIFKKAGWKRDELELIAISLGPGSFTGLRVGLAVAKTLAFASKIELIGIPTLDVMAQNISLDAKYVCPMTDARRGEIYSCLFKNINNQWERQWDYQTATAKDLCEKLPQETSLLGDAVDAYGSELNKRTDWRIAPKSKWLPRAAWVARLGYHRFSNGKSDDPHQLLPIYLRVPPVLEKVK